MARFLDALLEIHMRWLQRLLICFFVLCAATAVAATASPEGRPRLAVVIVVDQLRADYLTRFSDLFLPPGTAHKPGGFRYLAERGARFAAARYQHFPLFTGPGHAVILTGGYPYKTGIVANDWYSPAERSVVYSVADPKSKVVGGGPDSKAKPMGPANLRTSTLGDVLKMSTGGQAKVVSLSLKDRAAVLLGGRLTDASIWFDESTGRWISSTAYCKDGRLPGWVEAVNAKKIPESYYNKQWTPTLQAETLARLWKQPEGIGKVPFGLGAKFPHPLNGGLASPGLASYRAFTASPWGNDFALDTARAAIAAEKMGQDDIPDLLAINLSSNDYIGHYFGPDSPEVLEVTVQTDRRLSEFFRYLDGAVPGGLANVTIVLTADHGVAPMPETAKAAGFSAGRILDADIEAQADKALDERFGPREWVGKYVEPYLYLNAEAVAASKLDPELLQKAAARAIAGVTGVYAAYPRSQIEEGRLPNNEMCARLYKGFHPKVSGDVMVLTEAFWFTEETPIKYFSTHGTPYGYDTEVPLLLAGYGIRPGVYRNPVCPADIAPTLSTLLGIGLPAACDGVQLAPALK